MGKGELDARGGELLSIGAVELARLEGRSADDLDGTGTASVAPGHLVVKLGHGTSELEVAVLAVHVVRARAGIVAKPDSEVLHGAGVLLHDLDAVKDLASGLLHLAELAHEVPELGLGGDGVRGEDDHAERLGVGVLFSGGLAANHLVLSHESSGSHRGNVSVSDKIKVVVRRFMVTMRRPSTAEMINGWPREKPAEVSKWQVCHTGIFNLKLGITLWFPPSM